MSIVHVKSNTIGDMTGTVTVMNSAGSTVTAAATDLIRPSDWNSNHNMVMNLGGNTSGTSQVSSSDIVWAGGNNITLSASAGGVTVSGPNVSQYLTTAMLSNPTISFLGNTGGAFSTIAPGGIAFYGGNNITLQAIGGSQIGIQGAGVPADSWLMVGNTIPGLSNSGTLVSSYNLSGAGGISVGITSNTLAISAPAQFTGFWWQPEIFGNTTTVPHANGTLYLRPFEIDLYFDVDKIVMQQSYASSASTFSMSASVSAGSASSGTGSWGQSGTFLYFSRQNTNETNASYNSIITFGSQTYSQSAGYSASVSWSTNASSATASWTTSAAVGWLKNIDGAGGTTSGSSGTSGSSTFSSTSNAANSFSSSYVMSFPYAHLSGMRPLYINGSGSAVPPGEYWAGVIQSTNTGSTNMSLQRVAMMSSPGMLYYTVSTNPYAEVGNSVAITSSNYRLGFGSYSASSNTTNAIALTAVSSVSSNASMYFALDGKTL